MESKNIEWLFSVSLISFRAQYVLFGNTHGADPDVDFL